MEQDLIDAIDAPPMEGVVVLIATPEGWGGAQLALTITCGTVHPMSMVIEGIPCPPKKAQFEYVLVEPSTLIKLDIDIPRPCYLHINGVASNGFSSKDGDVVVGVSEEGPVVIGLPYSIYGPLYLQ